MTISAFRSRWAAIGAAVAVCLGAGGIGITQATTSSGEMPVYLPATYFATSHKPRTVTTLPPIVTLP